MGSAAFAVLPIAGACSLSVDSNSPAQGAFDQALLAAMFVVIGTPIALSLGILGIALNTVGTAIVLPIAAVEDTYHYLGKKSHSRRH